MNMFLVKLSFLFAASPSPQCTSTVGTQDVAIYQGGVFLNEPSIAVGVDSTMVVTTVNDLHRLRYGLLVGGTWTEGLIPAPAVDPVTGEPWNPAIGDPWIAYDKNADGYFVCALVGQIDPHGYVGVTRYDMGTSAWTSWQDIRQGGQAGALVFDKPVIVSGLQNSAQTEFYAFWWETDSGYARYRRTTDGGVNWIGGSVQVGNPLQPLTGIFAVQPTVLNGSRVYLAYMHVNNNVRFVAGRDDSQSGGMNFWELADETGQLLEISINAGVFEFCGDHSPGQIVGKFTPQIAIDPTDYDRFYVAWHDVDPDGACGCDSSRVSVWLQCVELDSSVTPVAWKFRFPSPVRIGELPLDCSEGCGITCNEGDECQSDKGIPMLTVDPRGWVWVAYYDDRGYDQVAEDVNVRYDLSLAHSCDGGNSFVYEYFTSEHPGEAFLDRSVDISQRPKEYNSIAYSEDGSTGVSVWVAATGTSSAESPPIGNLSAIYVINRKDPE